MGKMPGTGKRQDMDIEKMPELKRLLENETPVLTADIRKLYGELDRRFGLHGARIPISFGYEDDLLGSYTPRDGSHMEHFHFSLLFVGYAVDHPLSRADRIDLYKHEYAHYMQYNMDIPKNFRFQPGIHGSAWKYCCSLIGAAPTPYYRVGEGLMKHDYQEALRKKKTTHITQLQDSYRQQRDNKKKQELKVRYHAGEQVQHPKFGTGRVEQVEQTENSIRLQIRFADGVRKIDQKWILRANMR